MGDSPTLTKQLGKFWKGEGGRKRKGEEGERREEGKEGGREEGEEEKERSKERGES